MIHALHPADVASLLLFLSRSRVNEVQTRDRHGEREGLSVTGSLFREFMFERQRRRTLVYVHKGFVQGLVSVRARNGPGAWEIDRLLLPRAHDASCLEMLEKAGALGGEVGAEKMFLRLDSRSHLQDSARSAGFCAYVVEGAFVLEQPPRRKTKVTGILSRKTTDSDEQALFRLYSQSVPHQVRCAEGMTMQEWRDSRDRRLPGQEMVFDSGSEILAWLRIRRHGRSAQCQLMAVKESADLESILGFCMASLSDKRRVYWLLPEYQQTLRRLVEDNGFCHERDHVCLSKQIAARIREPQLVPMQA